MKKEISGSSVWAAVVLGVAVWVVAIAPARAQKGGNPAPSPAVGKVRPVGQTEARDPEGNDTAKVFFAQAELDRAEKALGPDHFDVATSSRNLAELYRGIGEYDRAEPLYQRALAIREKALGTSHPSVAVSLNELASLYQEKGWYDRAEPLYQRALATREKVLGRNHPSVADSLNKLALLYHAKGEYDRGEPLCQRALAIQEKALGPNHPAVATALDNLALMYMAKGEHNRAEPLHRRALAIREQELGAGHRDVALSLNNLASVYRTNGEYDLAEPLYLRALAILEESLNPYHPDVAQSLDYIGNLHHIRGEYRHAELFYQRAIALREKRLGLHHPDVATSLTHLASLYQAKGEYGRAEPLYRRALAIQEKALGTNHPDVAISCKGIATLYWAIGRLPEARSALARGQDVEEKTLGRLVATGSEAQKRAYLGTRTDTINAAITLALQAREPLAAHVALTTSLRLKGRALDAMAGSVRALHARLGSGQRRSFDDLQSARSEYVTLALRGPGTKSVDVYRRKLFELDEQIQRCEAAISEQGAGFRVDQQPITASAIQTALPRDTALIEWTVYRRFNPQNQKAWGPARYAACVLPKRGNPTCLDLGDEEAINADVRALRTALRRPANKQTLSLGRALETRVMAPVRTLLGDTRQVLLSPDGVLGLIPFAALTGEDGRPLIEHYTFTYLTSGRDLPRRSARVQACEGPLVLAGPDFDGGPTPAVGSFGPVLHAEEEAAAVSHLFSGTNVLLHKKATKARLEQTHGPRLLHISTHGYFESMACTAEPQAVTFDNPLLKSGIALVGANACARGRNEGLLTALEASGLDLHGTKLVVLSACQTGVGDVKDGDGVYGLRRALVLAGAETQVMSLWPVDGAATAELMKAYYEALARGGGRSEAMRGVQLAMLHDNRREHPYYWAGFIVSGDDRPLDDKSGAPDLRVCPGPRGCSCRLGQEAPASGAGWLGAAVAIGVALARRRGKKRGTLFRAFVLGIASIVVLLIPGCGAVRTGPARELPAEARAFLGGAPAVYAPERVSPVSPAETQALRAIFEGALQPEVRVSFRHEPALDLVAAVIAETYRDTDQVPVRPLVQWLFWKSGATSLYSDLYVNWSAKGSAALRLQWLNARTITMARKLKPSLVPLTYGVARFSRGKAISEAIVFGRAPLAVQGFQKTYAPGAPLTLQIRRLDESTDFTFLADKDDGTVAEEPMQQRADGSLFISRAVPVRPGRYFIEVRARTPRSVAPDPDDPWERSLLSVPIYVGITEPSVPDAFIRSSPADLPDLSAWPAWIVNVYNVERVKLGKRPLETDPRLMAMAAERSAVIASDSDPPPDRNFRKKLAAAGFPKQRYYQSFTPFESVSDLVHTNLLSPSARKRLVLSDRVIFGVGISPRPVEPGGRMQYTEVEYTVFPAAAAPR